MVSQKREQALKAAGCDGLPVKTVHTTPGHGDMIMELVAFEKKEFKKTDFDIPKGYKLKGAPIVLTQQTDSLAKPEAAPAATITPVKQNAGNKNL